MNQNNIFDVYDITKELGSGAFSVVKLGTRKNDGSKWAVKIINKKELGKDYEKNLKMEIDILKRVAHPNIIAMDDMFESDGKVYLVMELVTGGELFDKIVEKGNYSEKDAATLVHKMVEAVKYLHSQDIAHRDLKPENLLLKSKEDDLDVAIADFGLSKIVGETKMMQTACGTPGYVAPEVLNATGYGKEVDLWSIGVITYILLCGFPPFYGETVPELFEQIMKADFDYPDAYWGSISKEAKDFINHLLVVDSSKRLDADQALAHPWLQGKAGDSKLGVGKKLGKYVHQRKQRSKILGGELTFGKSK